MVLALAHGARLTALLWLAALVGAAGLVALLRRATLADSLAALSGAGPLVLESAGCALGVLFTGGSASPLLPYLIAPAFAAGFSGQGRAGWRARVIVPGGAALVLVVGRALVHADAAVGTYAATVTLWLLLAVGADLVATWVSLLSRPELRSDQASYVVAYRLLDQLRPVARKLSTGLGISALAEDLIAALSTLQHPIRIAVFTVTPGGQLWRQAGTSDAAWERDLLHGRPLARAWVRQRPVVDTTDLSSLVVLPLRIGTHRLGLVCWEIDGQPTPAQIKSAEELVAEGGLRLGSALLFEEVRELATAEERSRVAREIHDGIAQELASLGYRIDDLAQTCGPASGDLGTEVGSQLLKLRAELTRIVDDLRLSIFELRSDVERHRGLGEALSEYVRTTGSACPFTVHIVLDETPARLPAHVEAELLRIAQEAITNARKHAKAENLWVGCRVDPPAAVITIEDDGAGLMSSDRPGFGMDIMRERADRLGASLVIEPRQPAGTRVEIRLSAPEAGSEARHVADDAPSPSLEVGEP